MPLKRRILKITFSLPGGDVVLDETLDLHVRIKKTALGLQQYADIEVSGLSQSLREQLLSQFTAWNKRQVDSGKPQDWINVKIEAGYASPAKTLAVGGSYSTPPNEQTNVIFLGQVYETHLLQGPPDIITQICCASRQIDKTAYITAPAPSRTTFYEYVLWAANQLGFGKNLTFDSAFGSRELENPGRSCVTNSMLIFDIQNSFKPDVVAYVDNDQLIVRDRNRMINPSNIPAFREFIGAPQWEEWGVDFKTMFTGLLTLGGGATITSKLNPSVSATYVIYALEYELASRQQPFYVRATGGPPA